ncbi:MAG: bifunctional DNA-formamidopyrimidine glycosylase/DNA-(apurinic or apyrimidinic site) lyase [Caldilineaceae bacterium]|nr:bifunctional DNA-formamidopyrimidine glycosylase/DNA-(apurinic or apyrimidinic site) lyase [Caldilineaceae bacterium]
MPELPEVETYVRDLAPLLQNQTVTGVTLLWPRIIERPTPDAFMQGMVGQAFVHFGRRAKYMLLGLASGDTLIIHLRMTGRVTVYPQPHPPDKHTHVLFDLAGGGQVHYQDSRKFGRLWLVANVTTVVEKLGVEPLDPAFTAAYLVTQLAGRQASIKALLLDQTILAGVGNIYADESLFLAGIHPARPGGALDQTEAERLRRAVKTVLANAIEHHGSSLGASSIQNYARPSGELGGFQAQHRVFQRTGQPCVQCGQPIQRIVLGQRSTHFCPSCQH